MIIIHEGSVEKFDDRAVMTTDIEIDRKTKSVHVTVEKEYADFLSPERADYALTGMLAYALRNKHDIICEAPVTEELLYKIRETLIPTLIYTDARNYRVQIQAEMAPPLAKIRGGR